MKKKVAVALCGILLFAMLLPGCGSAEGQAGEQGVAEQVSNEKPQDDAETNKLKDSAADKEGTGSGKEAERNTNADETKPDNKKPGKDSSGSDNKTGADSGKNANTGGNSQGNSASTSQPSGNSENKPSGGGSNASNPSGGNSGNVSGGSTSGGNTSGTTTPSQPEHVHNWLEETKTVTHEATGHYEEKVVKDAWDEEVIERRAVCGCGGTFKDEMEWLNHVLQDECNYGYSVKPVVIDTIHHEAETKQVWVEDSPAWTETVGTGSYTCSTCGATK